MSLEKKNKTNGDLVRRLPGSERHAEVVDGYVFGVKCEDKGFEMNERTGTIFDFPCQEV